MDNMNKNDEAKRSSRRKFLKRTSAGAILASLPAASVWGQDSLIAGSIAASGHGSDYAGTTPIALLSPGKWKNWTSHWGAVSINAKYSQYTGNKPFGYGNAGIMKHKNGDILTNSEMLDVTLYEVIKNVGGGDGNIKGKRSGPSNINCYIAEMILNAANHGQTIGGETIHFPILKTFNSSLGGSSNPGLFADEYEFARYLHNNASGNEKAVAEELATFLVDHHV
ncbi:hypothetical protein LHL20_08525 [Alteromonas sp. McT4-15]|uniref:hypothetical protein n=1 Tax=unclassified Alteromonas TaxID=2614992 RepID=UPI001922F189|nr:MULTISPECIES: hypothetical protein [unclassified Alteromonas]MCB4436278.1 hypothetical protein [Alteromonas sp. McT4-15]BCO19914.1 hypothetical protein KUC3_27710 [Alteromonas sp. KC3]BCO23879.1 hypothetical protein KUC14_27480 [Alteromonas sp. KC14]